MKPLNEIETAVSSGQWLVVTVPVSQLGPQDEIGALKGTALGQYHTGFSADVDMGTEPRRLLFCSVASLTLTPEGTIGEGCRVLLHDELPKGLVFSADLNLSQCHDLKMFSGIAVEFDLILRGGIPVTSNMKRLLAQNFVRGRVITDDGDYVDR